MPQQLTLFEEMLQDLIGDYPTLHNVETIGLLSKTIHYAVHKALELAVNEAKLNIVIGITDPNPIVATAYSFNDSNPKRSAHVTVDKQSILDIEKLFI